MSAKKLNEAIIMELAPLLEKTSPTLEICLFLSKVSLLQKPQQKITNISFKKTALPSLPALNGHNRVLQRDRAAHSQAQHGLQQESTDARPRAGLFPRPPAAK